MLFAGGLWCKRTLVVGWEPRQRDSRHLKFLVLGAQTMCGVVHHAADVCQGSDVLRCGQRLKIGKRALRKIR